MAAKIVSDACFNIIFALQIGKSKITLRLNEAGEAGDFTCCKGGHGHHHLISDVLVQKVDCCSFRKGPAYPGRSFQLALYRAQVKDKEFRQYPPDQMEGFANKHAPGLWDILLKSMTRPDQWLKYNNMDVQMADDFRLLNTVTRREGRFMIKVRVLDPVDGEGQKQVVGRRKRWKQTRSMAGLLQVISGSPGVSREFRMFAQAQYVPVTCCPHQPCWQRSRDRRSQSVQTHYASWVRRSDVISGSTQYIP
uniref:Uncharacterized protein n=1 Tax=Branchiostoma floridae TaxID=7739 RepID=C3ZPJ0_BRAFL|eukprot:XP_002589548.1 hypothetical protein BRAFLDRAFT_128195 [Branchiostoma floridae]